MNLYIGSYRDASEPGIHRLSFDPTQGKLTYEAGYAGVGNPSYLIANRAGTRLYAVSEAKRGVVHAFRIDAATGDPEPFGEAETGGGSPCHLDLSADERLLFVSNYMGGNAVAFRLDAEGALAGVADTAVHEGSGARADRQEAPHPHSANVEPGGRYVIVPDLGIDKLMVYGIAGGGLAFAGAAALGAGDGPRHMAFHPRLPIAYVVNELSCTVTALAVETPFALRPLQTVTTLPADFAGENTCADLHATPDGAFLYASNRGHDSLAAYRIGDDGLLEPIGFTPTGGRTPRNFAIAPDGRFLLAANQDSDSLVLFRIDAETGALAEQERLEGVPRPVCVKFV